MSGLTDQDKTVLKKMFYPTLKQLNNGIHEISEKQEKSNERLIKLETISDNFGKLLEKEECERGKEDNEIKTNYLDRFKMVFDKLDGLHEIVLPLGDIKGQIEDFRKEIGKLKIVSDDKTAEAIEKASKRKHRIGLIRQIILLMIALCSSGGFVYMLFERLPQ